MRNLLNPNLVEQRKILQFDEPPPFTPGTMLLGRFLPSRYQPTLFLGVKGVVEI